MSDPHDNAHDSDDFLDDPEMLSDEDIADDEDMQEDDPNAALEAANREIAELKDRFLRLAAELDNTRRRAEREKADAGRYAISNFARDLIGVADNFDRALHAANGADEQTATVIVDGLRMTEKELLSVLDRHGIRRVAAAREKFDPHVHQAVAQIPHPDIPSGHVVDVAQQGFTIGDRVLRAAMVTVSSGPGAASSTGASDTPSAGPGERLDTKV
ncbi:nucleotide exchange factor GrpE [Hyphococcus sp.]|uniref:nucleotide exchange factor GrpE n=1 Tax=Hyphococcus sp. TaxID=2038636 RepID=UPI002088EB52|nr:MAG: protein GrpE [Marinicaulis sp.]